MYRILAGCEIDTAIVLPEASGHEDTTSAAAGDARHAGISRPSRRRRAARLHPLSRRTQHSARLEVAIRTFTMPSGQRVDLIGVVHIADDAYYQQLNQRFGAYDSVLFELVGDPQALTRAAPSACRHAAARAAAAERHPAGGWASISISRSSSTPSITPRKNMVHADTTAEEFDADAAGARRNRC